MSNSLLLAALILLLGLLCAWAVSYFGKRSGESPKKLRRLRTAFVAGGLVFALFAFWIDSGQRQVTLFEAVFPGSEGAEAPIMRSGRFSVEHPEVEHTLIVMPRPAFARDAHEVVSARVVLRMQTGETLISDRVSFGMRSASTREGPVRRVWEDHSWSFHPARTGPAIVEITLETSGVHEVFVRIEDPEKEDGVRAPGY